MPRIRVDQLDVHYQQAGAGPDVVLIHGFTSNLAIWAFSNILPTLARTYRVTAYDLRGHGRTSAPPSGYTSDRLADDWHALHAALGLAPAWIVGHSYGGVVAMHAAVRHPQTVAGVILSDAYFPGLAEIEPNVEHVGVWHDLRNTLAASGAEIGEQVDFDRLLNVVASLTPEQAAAIKNELGAPGARWLEQLRPLAGTTAGRDLFAVAGLDAEQLARVVQPVVALYDEHTPFGATCRWLVENLPDCRADQVPGARHLALLENPAGFVERVAAHLAALVDRPPAPTAASTASTASAASTAAAVSPYAQATPNSIAPSAAREAVAPRPAR